MQRDLLRILLGAAFLMATSAIGPGFLTQTAVFTERLGASMAFAILLSVIFDLAAQMNIWRVVAVAEKPAQDVANSLLPGLGTFLSILVALGGLAFNIGNVAGAGLGLNAMFDMPVSWGALISAVIAIGIFLVKEAGRAMDRFSLALGFLMIGLTVYVAVASHPPYADAVIRSVAPTQLDVLAVVTLVGGTVGGYITFAGAHRLLDAGVKGRDSLGNVDRSAATAIGVASVMRILLFLAALGVVTHAMGQKLDPSNPSADVFRRATGQLGYRIFGLVMWSAAITSVVGSAYTSVTFLRGTAEWISGNWTRAVVIFIVVSTAIFLLAGRPVKILILVGALNAMILPVSLGAMLFAAHRKSIVGTYRHPWALTLLGAAVAIAMTGLGAWTLVSEVPKLWMT